MSSEDMGTCHLTLAPHPQLDTQPGWVVATTQPLHLLQKSEVPFPPIVPPAGAMAGRLRFLAVLNKGPLGTGSSLRTTYPVHPGATTVFPSLIKDNTGRGTVHSRGNHLPPPVRGHCRTHRSPQRRLFLHNFQSSQEERRPSTYNKSERAQQVHPPSSLQDGGNSNVEGPHLSGGLYVQTRPQGYLFYGPHHSFSPEVSLLSVGEQNIPLQMPSIWALQRSSNIYKGNKTDCLFPQTERGKDGDITRRYVVSTSSEGEACGNHKPGPRPAGEPGLPSELQEVRTGASSTNQLFLGFKIDSLSMEIKLPREKVLATTQEARELITRYEVSVQQLAHMIGIFSSTIPAVLPAPLHYRGLQSLKHQGLRSGNYNSVVPMSREAREDLDWWVHHLQRMNGQPIQRGQPSLVITTDASLQGWGAHCQHHNIGSPWTPTEKDLHINCLELLGASHAVKALCKGGTNMIVQLKMDSSTAIAYINHLGGTRSSALCSIATHLWEWCLDGRIFLLASHVPGVQNTLADRLSRSAVDRHDWMLNRSIFRKLNTLWGPLVVDLFATRATAQLPRFFSWKPDSQAEAVDAFTQDWSSFRGYANAPWSLVGRCIQHIKMQKATIVLVTPLWPSQPWFAGGDQQIKTITLPGIYGSNGAQTTTGIPFLPL